MTALNMLIGGELSGASRTFSVVNPATERIVGEAPECDQAQLEEAVQAAEGARFGWAVSEDGRREYLLACAHAIQTRARDIGSLLTEEQGKPLAKALAEVELAAMWFRQTANLEMHTELLEDSDTARVEVRRRPIGVVAAITPWNYPIILAVCKVAPALRTGNTVVLKPSPFTPLSTLLLGETLAEVLPPGALNVLTGGDQLGARLVQHPLVRKVSFTGSIAGGRSVASAVAKRFARVTLEMGGNDAAILLDDIDPMAIAGDIFWGAFENSGQYCSAIKRLYVHRSVHDVMVDRLSEIAKEIRVGDGRDASTDLGPVSTAPQYRRVGELMKDVRTSGGSFAAGGASLDRAGYFFEPSLVTGLDNGNRLVDEEQFGPVLPIIPFDDIAEAVAKANATHYGLGGSVWSSDSTRAEWVASRLDCGTVWINQHGKLRADTPFGGLKSSGVGVEYGLCGLLEFTEIQVINARIPITS